MEARVHDAAEQVTHAGWLPLQDALQDVDTLKRLIYRLIMEGKLRSREGLNGAIEIWIHDKDPVSNESMTSGAALGPEPLPLTLDVVLDPLVSGYERNVRLARENGLLGERVAGLRRQLLEIQDAAASDKRMLEHATVRLRALEAANARLMGELVARHEEQTEKRPRRRPLPVVGTIVRHLKASG